MHMQCFMLIQAKRRIHLVTLSDLHDIGVAWLPKRDEQGCDDQAGYANHKIVPEQKAWNGEIMVGVGNPHSVLST